MNKNAKGAIAVGAAVLLLLGGGGTFALWNTTAEISAGQVNTGHLTIADTTGAWKDQNGNAFDPAVDTAVPGDVLTYTATSTVSAEGKNLEFTAFIEQASLEAALAQGWTVVGSGMDVTGTGFATATDQDGDVYNPSALPESIDVVSLTTDTASGTLTYHFTIAFGDNATAGSDNATHDSTSTLNSLTLTVQQVFKK